MSIDGKNPKGHLHPLTQVINDVVRIFSEMGFSVALGPEIEDEYHNFDALNVPADHPARDLWDTFWLKENKLGSLLRTHTSPVQIRYMEKHKPPLAIVVPGKTFRYEATDATHEAQFHQVEGLMVGKDISIANLKGILEKFFQELFGENVSARLRPSYFPFVEPGVEVDMSCFKCSLSGKKPLNAQTLADSAQNNAENTTHKNSSKAGTCSLCKGSGWIEIMGAGQVHPNVLNNVGIDPREWQGFAFGGGIDRIAMLKYGVDDIRLFYNGDLRLVNQF